MAWLWFPKMWGAQVCSRSGRAEIVCLSSGARVKAAQMHHAQQSVLDQEALWRIGLRLQLQLYCSCVFKLCLLCECMCLVVMKCWIRLRKQKTTGRARKIVRRRGEQWAEIMNRVEAEQKEKLRHVHGKVEKGCK